MLLQSLLTAWIVLGIAAGAAGAAETPAAKVGGETISLEEIQRALKDDLAKLDRQRHQMIEEKLDQLIAEKLLAAEAARRGVAVDALLRQEVNARTPKVTDQEVDKFLAENRARYPQGGDAELRLKIWEFLREQKVNQRRGDYLRALAARDGVTIFLEDPAALRADPARGFARGAKDAPVTIVEFSDFQCPFCQAVTATMRELVQIYAGKVRWVFRDFPIPSLHPLAPKAHEAARCAAEQGEFWEYHDLLFQRAPLLSPPELKQYARDLQLDGAGFDQCLDSGRQLAAVVADGQEGERLGASGTPTFFINGRMIVGAQPLTAFQQIIDSELAKKPAQ